ncbi:Gfo/Idh/MocA family oxidoreductase [Pirellulales bacterium]|nr:Gfo/Idh/MocA family oxidoreductase [Pirellulales bacterium]
MVYATRRKFLHTGLISGVTLASTTRNVWSANANNEVNLGFIGCGGRGNILMTAFSKVPGVTIGGLCDPDKDRLEKAKERFPKAQTWADLRDLLDDPSIDAVVIATCNHWHCLAAIWAMEAGKDVYVEKPLSHSQWEGEQTVAAAEKTNRICQLGTQQRSDPMQAHVKKFLHEERGLGKILSVQVNRIGMRSSIGKRATPLPIAKEIDYDLWLGPAKDEPIFRDKLQYDWHWNWNTGSGEMGNWGIHILDDVRNVVFRDRVKIPKRIQSIGGRVVWNDAGSTPNAQMVAIDTGSVPVQIQLMNIAATPGGKKSPPHMGPGSGYIVHCTEGHYEGRRGGGVAFDPDGKEIQSFKGNSGNVTHQQNFIDAVRKRDRRILNADIVVGNDSTAWCNLANSAFRASGPWNPDSVKDGLPTIAEQSSVLAATLLPYDIRLQSEDVKVSPILELNSKTGRFIGADSERANRFFKRTYRSGYAVPEMT